jgi:hypothetical protein
MKIWIYNFTLTLYGWRQDLNIFSADANLNTSFLYLHLHHSIQTVVFWVGNNAIFLAW